MTRETVNKLPEHIRVAIEEFKRDYKNAGLRKDEVRSGLAGYAKGLRDAGLITERERQILFVYGTV